MASEKEREIKKSEYKKGQENTVNSPEKTVPRGRLNAGTADNQGQLADLWEDKKAVQSGWT